MTDNRIDPLAPPKLEPVDPIVSPTGTPVVSPRIVPWVTALVSLAAAGVATFPPHTTAFKVCAAIAAFGGVFGIVSPGMRRKTP